MPTPAQTSEFTRYVILLSHAPGKALNEEVIRRHVAHLKRLDEAGKLCLGGPFIDYKGGMVVLRAASREEAENLARMDPFIKEGFESYELRTLELSCKENNHLGMG